MSTVAVAYQTSTADGSGSAPNRPSTIRTGKLAVHLNTRVVSVNHQPVDLTHKEYEILELLSLRKGATVTREMFLNHLYGGVASSKPSQAEPEQKIIDVFVCKLRKKLARATHGNHYIETIWGRGYQLRDPALTPAATLLAGAQDRDARNDKAGSRAA